MKPVVSVVIGVMNGAATLERCLDSITAQTFQAREVLVKDAVSKDGTVAILERRQHELAGWYSEPDLGLYDAWNRIIPEARGAYICFLGADDAFADPTALERLLAPVDLGNPPDLICSLNALTSESGRFIKVLGKPWDWPQMQRAQVIAHPGMMHHASLFRRHGLFDASFGIAGDYEWLLRLGPEATSQFVPQITVRMGAGGMSHSRAGRTFREIWQAQRRHASIGFPRATKNYGANLGRFALRKLRGKR